METNMDPDNLPKFVYLHKNHKYRLKLGFYAAPSNPKTFSKAIRNELLKLKFTYCSDLNGLIMGFGKISSNELIQADIRHCINVAIHVDVYIFRPPVGSIIEAIVNQISDNHVSCLVHNLFNVSIVRPEHQPYMQWSGSKIKKDDKINVKVLSFDLTKKLPHITGDIVDNVNDEHFSSKDKQDNFSSSSSSEKSTNDLLKSIKEVKEVHSASSSKSASSNSESSDETNDFVINSNSLDKKSTKTLPVFTCITTNNNKYIEDPLGSSTPISCSEHTVGSINLIRNKQLEQLHKHLAKNSNEKHKSLENFIKSPNKFAKDNHSQSSNISKDDNSDVEVILPTASSINRNYNLFGANKINQPSGLQSDSGISDDERKQTIFPVLKTSSNTSGKSFKTTETNSIKVDNSILHSVSSNKTESETNISKHNVFDSTITDHSNEDETNVNLTQLINDIHSDEESSDYTQHIYNLSNREMVPKTSNKLIIIEKPKLRLSTKSSKKIKTPLKKDKEDFKNQSENEIVKKCSSITSSIASNSESSIISCRNKKYDKLPNSQELDHTIHFIKEIEKNKTNNLSQSKINLKNMQDSSSSDDEVYIKLRQNISKVEDTKPLDEKPNSRTFNEIYSNDEENYSPSDQIFHDELIKSPSKLFNSTITAVKSTNKLETDECNINTTSNFLPIKDTLKKEKKNKLLKKETEFLQSSKLNEDRSKVLPNSTVKENNKNEMIKQILKEDSSSTDDAVKCISPKNQLVNQKDFNEIPTSSTSNKHLNTEKNQVISNPFLKLYSANSTSSSSDDEKLLSKLRKSKEIKPSFKKKNISLEKEENKKKILIKKLLTSVKQRDLKHQLKLDVEDVHTSSSDEGSKLIKTKELNKNKSKIVTKNKNVSCILTNSVEENKLKKKTSNVSQQSNLIQLKLKSPISDSTDDEIDVIKKIIDRRKLNKYTEPDVPDLTMKDNIPSKLLTFDDILGKLNNKLKSQNASTKKVADKKISDIVKIKKKRPKNSKDLFLDSIKNSMEDSQSSHTKKKKKKKDQNSVVVTNVSMDNNSDETILKKKSSKNVLLDTIVNSIENSQSSHIKKKKKKKDQNSMVVTNVFMDSNSGENLSKNRNSKDSLLDSIINSIENPQSNHAKKKKKKKDQNSTVVTNFLSVDTNSDETISKKKSSKNVLLDTIVDSIENSQSSHIKKKKKKNDHNSMAVTNILSVDTNSDETILKKKSSKNVLLDTIMDSIENSQSSHVKKKKKKNDQNSMVVSNVSINSSSGENVSKIKSSKDLLLDSIMNSIEDPQSCPTKKKKKKKDQNSVVVTNVSMDNNSDKSLSKKKKKKNKHIEKVDFNNLTLNYNPKEDNSYVISEQPTRETNTSNTDKLKKKVKRLESDPIRYDTQDKITNKLSLTDGRKKNKSISLKKTGSNKKLKQQILGNSELKQFLLSQNEKMMNSLDNLYKSLNSS